MKYYGIQNEVKSYINRLQSEEGIVVSPSAIKTINDRVESLKKSGVWSRFSLGFNDVDGDAYLTRAGVTNPLGRCEVLWFTRGMKALDLWASIICWPFRSMHNAGSGLIVYSLGGFHSQNASLISGSAVFPSWTNNGISITATNQGINTGINQQQVFGTRGLFSSIFRLGNTNNEADRIITCDVPGGTTGFGMDDFSAPSIRFLSSGGTGSVLLSNFNPSFGFITTGKGELPFGRRTFVNNTIDNLANTSTFDSPVTFPSSSLGVGGRHLVNSSGNPNPVDSKLQVNALLIAYKTYISSQEHQLIYTLLKATLGNGLGLP